MQSSLHNRLLRTVRRIGPGMAWFILLVSPVIAGQEGPARRTVRNPETTALGWLLEGNRIQAMFKDGTYVKAKVQKVERDRLLLSVDESEGPAALDQGEQNVALSRFSTITVTRYEGCKRAVLGFTLGTLGTAAGLGLGMVREDEAGPGTAVAVVGISAGSIVGAYLLGRHLDQKEITIIID